MPVTILPSPLRGFSESVGEGVRAFQRGRRLSLEEERLRQEAIQRQTTQAFTDPRVRAAREFLQVGQPGVPTPPLGAAEQFGVPEAQRFAVGLPQEEFDIRGGIQAKRPAPGKSLAQIEAEAAAVARGKGTGKFAPTDKKLTPIQMLDKSVALWDKDPVLARKLGNEALKQSGSTFRFEVSTDPQVGKGMAELMIDYNAATEKIDFNLPANAVELDKIESGLLKDLTQTESYLRATPDNQTKMANAAGKFFQAKRKMRQKSRTVRETILDKVIAGKELTPGEQKVYDETIKRKDPQTPSEAGALQEARTTARLTAYREERTRAIETNDLDGLRSLITDAEEKLLGRADPEEVERLMWGTLEAHYRTKSKPEISPDEFEQMSGELAFKFGYDDETVVRLLRLQFKVIQ